MPEFYYNNYKFINDLGSGGFGKVFLAQEKISNRFVAIKQLLVEDTNKQQNIIKEIEVVSQFKHSNIVTYYHHFFQDGLLFLVMEYCEGGSLRDKIRSIEITPTKALSWVKTLADCMRQVHKKGIIHHDIKPDNILFTENGTIKISDFGVANTGWGTTRYQCPEIFSNQDKIVSDPRVDIYALGVTLMEILIRKNPFSFLSEEQIIELHQSADFPINELPNWQQEIILKAINKVPELRFQYMVEFSEAIDSQSIPVIFNQDLIKAAEIADLAEHALKRKKWKNALKYLEFGYKKYPDDVSLLQSFGKYCLATHRIFSAKQFYEKALRINTRLDLQKDLGWINLENKKYPTAISLLSDHLHRHPSDYESYNLLLRCYYETNRYEPAMELAKMLTESNPHHLCFANNLYISYVLHHKNKRNNPEDVIKPTDCHFVNYNKSVFQEKQASYDINSKPTLKSKLLFMEFQFNNFKIGNVSIVNSADEEIAPDLAIIKIGRKGFITNDIEIANGTSISRRHCLIINAKNDTWLYDLESTGTYLNGELINNKSPIIELHKLRIGDTEFIVKPDKGRLFT